MDWEADPDWEFRTAESVAPEELRDRYRQAGTATVALGQDHACIVGTPRASIDWSALTNPILSFPGVGVKDQALQWSGWE